MQREVRAGGEHEDDDDPLGRRVVVPHHRCGAFLEDREQVRATALNLVHERGDGRAAGRERDVDADALEQPQVRHAADTRDDLADTELPPEQRREEIALVVVDDRHEHVAAPDLLQLEQLEIRAVAAEHQRAAERRGQQLAASPVLLDDPQLDLGIGVEQLRQAEPDVAAAYDRHELGGDGRGVSRDERLHLPHRLGGAHHDDLVPLGELRVAMRDLDRVVALHGRDQRAARQAQRLDGARDERRPRLEPVLEQLDAAAREHLGVDGARGGDDPRDRFGELGLGPEHAFDAEMLAHAVGAAIGAQEIVLRHEADRPGDAQPPGDRAGHQVDLVEAGARNQQVGAAAGRAPQHVGVRRAARHELDVQRLEPLPHVRVVVDDEDAVLARERARQRVPDFAAADDDDLRLPPRLYIAGAWPPADRRGPGASCRHEALTRGA